MKGVILAAGRGSRLGPLTDDRPKCLTPVGGRPLIEWQVAALRGGGVSEVIVATGYRAELLAPYADRTVHNSDWAETNMVHTFLGACRAVAAPLLVSYSDILYDAAIVADLADHPADCAVAYDPAWQALWQQRFDNPLDDAESFAIDGHGIIIDIGRRVSRLDEIQGQYMGLMKFSQTAIDWITTFARENQDRCRSMDMTTLLRHLVGRGHALHGVALTSQWMEVDRERDLQIAERLFGTA